MKTDRELLELAAKAAGISLHRWVGKGLWMGEEDEEGFQTSPPELSRWNPLTDDGDAMRLAVNLSFNVFQAAGHAFAMETEGEDNHIKTPYEGNKYAATRRAIVRAAAAIGEAMQ